MNSSLSTIVAGAAVLLLGAAACSSQPDSVKQAQQTNEAKLANPVASTSPTDSTKEAKQFDSEFMTKAASGGLLEVQLGREVARRATTPEAKQFAQQMITDHTKGNAELQVLAAKRNITLPPTLGADQQQVYNAVLAEKGAQLDQKYVKEMIADHQEDIKEYQEAASKATDPAVKAFAIKTIPMLQMHLQAVSAIQPAVNAKK